MFVGPLSTIMDVNDYVGGMLGFILVGAVQAWVL